MLRFWIQDKTHYLLWLFARVTKLNHFYRAISGRPRVLILPYGQPVYVPLEVAEAQTLLSIFVKILEDPPSFDYSSMNEVDTDVIEIFRKRLSRLLKRRKKGAVLPVTRGERMALIWGLSRAEEVDDMSDAEVQLALDVYGRYLGLSAT